MIQNYWQDFNKFLSITEFSCDDFFLRDDENLDIHFLKQILISSTHF